MKKAAIVYRSRTGTTQRLAKEIGAFLATRAIEPTVVSIGECDVRALGDVDYLFLGCWTSGLMVVLQHPDQPWIEFARDLPAIAGPRVGLFTTYKLASGSMFAQMRKHLASARRLTLHLPADGPWAAEFLSALARPRAIPLLA
jgi:flavodoxin